MDKVVQSVEDALSDIQSGASIAVGGFGLAGIPTVLLAGLRARKVGHLSVISNNCGVDDAGLGLLLGDHLIDRITASYVGENKEFERQYLAGEVEVEFAPQGSLAERLRAGGSGIPVFYTRAGVGTPVGDGGIPQRFRSDGSIEAVSAAKEVRVFGGVEYLLEEAIVADFALVRARVADRSGNLVFHASARNFNPLCAMAGRTTVVEAEEIVAVGELGPDDVHLPGVFVQRIVQVPIGTEKRVERLTTRTEDRG